MLPISLGFPDRSAVKAGAAGATGDAGLIPGSGRPPGGGHGNPLQYSCLRIPMDRGAWQATVQRVTKSWTCLKWLSTYFFSLSHPFLLPFNLLKYPPFYHYCLLSLQQIHTGHLLRTWCWGSRGKLDKCGFSPLWGYSLTGVGWNRHINKYSVPVPGAGRYIYSVWMKKLLVFLEKEFEERLQRRSDFHIKSIQHVE